MKSSDRVEQDIEIVQVWSEDYGADHTWQLQLWAMGMDLLNRLQEVDRAVEPTEPN
jgi:hypothetical protein